MSSPSPLFARVHAALFATEARSGGVLFISSLVLGVILGAAIPGETALTNPQWRLASSIIGWTYFSAWSLSFWPQVVQNHIRGSVEGLSFDFLALNLLGFSAYSAYNCALYYSPAVRQQYADANKGSLPGVASNDVFFGLHAIFATLVTIAQCFFLRRGPLRGHVTPTGVFVFAAAAAAIAGLAGAANSGAISWLDFCTDASYVKLAISLTKYIPQVILNARLRSTRGWNIHNVLLDFTGGFLSTAQLVGDALNRSDWSSATSNPVKFGLGFASMFFDVIFMAQHYCLYAGKLPGGGAEAVAEAAASMAAEEEEEGRASLLRGGDF